jgi:microcin C transport system substrate-binding protein
MVYDAWRLALPGQIPAYSPGELWAVYAWWAK